MASPSQDLPTSLPTSTSALAPSAVDGSAHRPAVRIAARRMSSVN